MPCYTWITFRWEEFLLRAIQRWLDKFCYRHPGFGIPNLMLIVAIGNLLVYVLDMFSGAGASLAALLAFALLAAVSAPWVAVAGLAVALALGYRIRVERNASGFSGDFQQVVRDAAGHVKAAVDQVVKDGEP